MLYYNIDDARPVSVRIPEIQIARVRKGAIIPSELLLLFMAPYIL